MIDYNNKHRSHILCKEVPVLIPSILVADSVLIKIILVILFVAFVLFAETLVDSDAMTLKGHFLVKESIFFEFLFRMKYIRILILLASLWIFPVIALSLLVEKEEKYEHTD